ncbi:MAG: hypothetical protein AAFV53_27350 [Myxococcota bacterium]
MNRRLLWAPLLALVACNGDGDRDGDRTASDDTGVMATLCMDAPVVTWDNFGQGFMTENCQACHASTTSNRRGAPEDITFDDHDTTLTHSERILARSTGDAPSMPPLGGVNTEDQYLLEVWLTCWEATN